MKLKVIFPAMILVSALIAAIACQTSASRQGSETKQLKDQLSSFQCPGNPSRVAHVKEAYGQYLVGNSQEWRNHALDVLSVLPEEYLAWIFTKYQVKVFLSNMSGGITDLVINGGNPPDRPAYPTQIRVSPGQPHYFPLQHELGHAIQPYLDTTHKTFYKSFHHWFQNAALGQHSENQHMWSYPKTDNAEYWAELFDSYYCGANAREHMKITYPRSYQFALRYLISPDNLDASYKSTSAWKVENEPNGDEDGDGIKNSQDLCAATESGANVFQDGEYKGCAGGQFKDLITTFMGGN